MNIKVKTGANQALVDLLALAKEPHCEGLRYPLDVYGGTTVFEDGLPFVVLRWKVLTASQYTTILASLGLTSAKVATLTILVPGDDRSTGTRYNGQAVKTRARWEHPLYYDVEALVRRLTAAS